MKLKALLMVLAFALGSIASVSSYLFYEKRVKMVTLSEDERLGNFALLMMDIVGADLSPVRRTILARTIVRVSGEILSNYSHREAFIGLVAQESRFNANAKSPVGASGLTQIMPQYASEFAKLCGLNDFKQTDLFDAELNLYLGACFFRSLLENKVINGNPVAAKVAYNSGLNGAAIKGLLAQRGITNLETNNYSTMIEFKKEEAKNAQVAIEKATKEVTKSSSLTTALEVAEGQTQIKSDQLIVRFRIQNTNPSQNATGAVVAVGTFLTNNNKKIYISSGLVTGTSDPQVDDLLHAAKTTAQPFSIKKLKDYELPLPNPKGETGQFIEYKIFALDTRTGGYLVKNYPVAAL